MAISFDMLGSGSTGNCGLMVVNGQHILIDAGFSCKKLKDMLSSRNVDINDIRAVFITHEHIDHIQGLRGLRKYGNIQFFANKLTADAIEKKFEFGINWRTFNTGDNVIFSGINIMSFSIPHDAVDPIGYVFSAIEKKDGGINSLAWMTDLGYIPSNIVSCIKDADLLVIESNYDNDLLTADSKRPPYIKARIRSRYGHLPNEAAINFVKNAKDGRWKKVVFAHVSADCNSDDSIKSLLGNTEHLSFEYDIASA